MGQIIQKVKNKFRLSNTINLFMLGNSAAGRTTMLYKWKNDITVNAIPTIGFNVENIQHKDVTFSIWEAGGGDRIRPLFVHYMQNQDGLIVVVDSSCLYDQNLLQTTLQSLLLCIYKDKLIPLLILANKKDKCKHSDQEILNFVGVQLFQDKIFYKLIYTNCFSGEGLTEALDWLQEAHSKKR